jgi:hypothetical protein
VVAAGRAQAESRRELGGVEGGQQRRRARHRHEQHQDSAAGEHAGIAQRQAHRGDAVAHQ